MARSRVVSQENLIVDIINVQLTLQRVYHRTHLQGKLDTLTQVRLELPFTNPEVDILMTLRQELNDFKVILCQRVVFFVPCEVLILLVTDDDRLTECNTRIGSTIRHLPLFIAQGNAKTSYLLRECSLS